MYLPLIQLENIYFLINPSTVILKRISGAVPEKALRSFNDDLLILKHGSTILF